MQLSKLSQFLKDARHKAGLSQSEVSDLLGYSTPQFISNWERGLSQPPIPALKALSKAYSISEKNLCAIYEEAVIEQVRLNLRREFSINRKAAKG